MSLFHERVGDIRHPAVRIICDTCGATADFTVGVANKDKRKVNPEHKRTDLASLDLSQANRKATAKGWHVVRDKHYCPACVAERRAVAPQPEAEPAGLPAPVELTPALRRAIRSLLDDVYDTEAGRYNGDATDALVAEIVGGSAAWVAEERMLGYGSGASNAVQDAIAQQIAPQLQALEDRLNQFAADAQRSFDTFCAEASARVAELQKAAELQQRAAEKTIADLRAELVELRKTSER